MDARALDDGADSAAGDDAGSRRGGLEEHLARAEVTADLVRHGRAVERDVEDVLPRLVVALADGLGDLVGLAETDAHVARLVAHDDERRKGEAPTALDHLGHAVDGDDALLEFLFVNLVRRHGGVVPGVWF